MNNLIKIKIKESGLKKSFIAEKLGIQPNYFYMCLKGSRTLSLEKENKLREILK